MIRLPSTQSLLSAHTREIRAWGVQQTRTIRKAHLSGGHIAHGGQQWAPRTRVYPWPILLKTGRLMRSTFSRMEGSQLLIRNDCDYVGFHQFGTKKMVARPVVVVTGLDNRRRRIRLKAALERAVRVGA